MIYVSSSCIGGRRISDVVRRLAQGGFRNIELSGGTSYYPEIFDDLAALKKEYDLTYACHSYFPPPQKDFVVNLASCNDEIYNRSIQHYKNCIRRLPDIGCTVLSIHSGFFLELSPDELGSEVHTKIEYDIEQSTDRFCEAYEEIRMLAKAQGIEIYLENNVIDSANFERLGRRALAMMADSDAILALKKRLDFRLLLDLGHLNATCYSLRKDFETEAKILAPHVEWLHLSNNNAIADQHRPLTGDCAVAAIYRSIAHPGDNVTLETKGDLEEIAESYRIVNSIDFLNL